MLERFILYTNGKAIWGVGIWLKESFDSLPGSSYDVSLARDHNQTGSGQSHCAGQREIDVPRRFPWRDDCFDDAGKQPWFLGSDLPATGSC